MDSSNDYLYMLGWQPLEMAAVIDTSSGNLLGTAVMSEDEAQSGKVRGSPSTAPRFRATRHLFVAELMDSDTGRKVLLPLETS